DSIANDGNYTYVARVEDAAGNQGVESNEYQITLDTAAPSQTVTITDIVDDEAPQTGSVAHGGSTNDKTPTLHGSLDAALGAGEEILIFRDGTQVGKATVAADGVSWSFEDNLTNDGNYSYTAQVVDKAGNTGTVSNQYDIELDTKAPTQSVSIDQIIDDVDPTQGDIGDKGITNDTTPTLKGSLSQALGAGEYLAIYRNGSEIARLSEA
ncbi:Ig-like domain-containing protein, partial [Pseudomonas sp. F1_0610]|uniref:Ig-like domain-containing protein n=1 Tax=Pseudomonas sp. F1_0610 TaxID=3114284 RepID=UPI0039C21227